MTRRSRSKLAMVVSGVVLTASVAGCASDDDDDTIQSSTAVVPTASASTTSSDLPVDPAPTLTAVTAPVSTEPTTAPTATPDQSVGGYEEVSADRLLHLGDDGSTHPVDDPLADGVYFADSYALNGDGSAVAFELARFTSAEACIESLDTVAVGTVDQSGCYGGTVDTSATATVSAPLDSDVPVILVTADFRFFQVPMAEFARLLLGEAPAPDAPADFEYQPYWKAMVEIADGAVVRANQQPSS